MYISPSQGWRFVSFVSSAISWYGFLIPPFLSPRDVMALARHSVVAALAFGV